MDRGAGPPVSGGRWDGRLTPSHAGEDQRRLLLVGINYAPEETGIAPYTTGMAEHLTAAGWHVRVLTGMPHYPQWRIRDEYRGRLRAREQRAGVEVRRVRHYVPIKQTALRRTWYEITFLTHAATASEPRPDCVVGIVPSLGGGVVAAEQARRHGVPFGLIIQDLMGPAAAQSGIPGGGRAAGPARALEGWVARRAAGVAVVTEGFRTYLEGLGVAPGRITHLANWSHVGRPTGSRGDCRRAMGWGGGEQIVLHAGNMGFKQGLDNVIEAARLAAERGLPIRFVLMGGGSDRRRLEALGSNLSTLQFLEAQPGETFMDVLGAADVLLINEHAKVRDMSLPSKITSYFLAGRPVVAAVRGDGSTAAELTRSEGALFVRPEDPAALVATLRLLARDCALQEQLSARALAYAREHHDRPAQLELARRFVLGVCSDR